MATHKNILFISTLNLAANPRLYKEVKLATNNDFIVTVLLFKLGNQSDVRHNKLKEGLSSVKFIEIPADRKPFLPWFLSSTLERLARYLPTFIQTPRIISYACSKRSFLLLRKLKYHISRYDWVIAHNPGSFYPACWFANKCGASLGIDVEDYHPGETADNDLGRQLCNLMKYCLPKASYVSFASKLIKLQVEANCGSGGKQWLTIRNCFEANEFLKPPVITGPLKLVWFSQHISFGRGIELVLPFLCEGCIELHLFGKADPRFIEQELNGLPSVIIHETLPQGDLHAALSGFDIGLALEPGKDLNNKLALSNKIIAYLQSGLYILATNTPAQEEFLGQFPTHGKCFADTTHLGLLFDQIINNIACLREDHMSRYDAGGELSFEVESKPLLRIWESNEHFIEK